VPRRAQPAAKTTEHLVTEQAHAGSTRRPCDDSGHCAGIHDLYEHYQQDGPIIRLTAETFG
jgi:hypothetical protein